MSRLLRPDVRKDIHLSPISAPQRSRATFAESLAPWLHCGNGGQIRGKFVGLECFDVHFNQTNERTAEFRFGLAAAIDDDAGGGHDPTLRTHNVDRFLDASAPGHNVFRDDKPFTFADVESAPQNQSACFLFHEDVAFAQGAADFLTDNDSAEGGGDHGVTIEWAELIGEPPTNLGGDVRVLQEQGALKILAAVQPGTQDKIGRASCRERV